MKRIWWALLALSILVLLSIVFLWWTKNQLVESQSLNEGTALISRPDSEAIDRTVLTDPLSSEPCFFSGSQTCQLNFYVGENAGEIRLLGSRLVQPQRSRDLWFLTSRMLTQSSELSRKFSQQIQKQADPNPLYVMVVQMQRSGLEYGVNPAFLFAYYDLLLAAAESLGIDLPVVDGELTPKPDEVARAFKTDRVENFITDYPWTKAGTKVIQASAELLPPALVQEMFAVPAELERRYLSFFSPEGKDGTYSIQLTDAVAMMERVSDPGEEREPHYFTAFCRNLKAYICRQEGTQLMCDMAGSYDLFCPDYLLSLRD